MKLIQQCNHPTLWIENQQLYHNTQLSISTFHFFKWKTPEFLCSSRSLYYTFASTTSWKFARNTIYKGSFKRKKSIFFPLCMLSNWASLFQARTNKSLKTTLAISKTTTPSSNNNNRKNTGYKLQQTCYTHAHTSPHITIHCHFSAGNTRQVQFISKFLLFFFSCLIKTPLSRGSLY